MSDIAIRVENLGKQYRLGEFQRYRTFRETFSNLVSAPFRRFSSNGNGAVSPQRSPTPPLLHSPTPDTIWALRDVSFEVPRGQVLGIIGRNGAGKSTLLKILSRITEPTTGRVEIHGRVGSLLEVGTGFHPELTGRENIFVNGAILGMSRTEIKRKFDEIVEFAGVEKFLDTPVKRYSSGMQVRLAFAVAAHLEPEILVVDEVLAVGDTAFQNRCIRKMEDVAQHGRTVLFVSHNMAAVESLCTRALLFEQGYISTHGEVLSVMDQYLSSNCIGASDVDLLQCTHRLGVKKSVLRRLRILDVNGSVLSVVELGGDAVLELELDTDEPLRNATIAVMVYGSRGERVITCNSLYQYGMPVTVCGKVIARCVVRNWRLVPGRYRVALALACGGHNVDSVESGLELEIAARDIHGTGRLLPAKCGIMVPEVSWQIWANGAECLAQ